MLRLNRDEDFIIFLCMLHSTWNKAMSNCVDKYKTYLLTMNFVFHFLLCLHEKNTEFMIIFYFRFLTDLSTLEGLEHDLFVLKNVYP